MVELVRGFISRIEKKHGLRGIFIDITHQFDKPLLPGSSWFLEIPPEADFEEGQEVKIMLDVPLQSSELPT